MHKLGLHINRFSPEVIKWAKMGGWTLIKYLETNEGILHDIRAANPTAIFVGRMVLGEGMQTNPKEYVDRISQESSVVKMYTDYWECYNECITDEESAKEHVWKSQECSQRLHDLGLHHCALSLAVGNPSGSDDDIKRMLDILWPAVESADAWSYHSYGYPLIIPDDNWHALRYRRYVQLDPRYRSKLLLLTEGGFDGGIGNDNPTVSFSQNPKGYRGFGVSDEKYANQLIALDEELQKDDYVGGVALYQLGNTSDWDSFSLQENLLSIIHNHISKNTTITTPPNIHAPNDPIVSYFGQYGHAPSAESALYKFALKPSYLHAVQLRNAGETSLANLSMPGPCLTDEYIVQEDGVTKYRIELTNEVLEVQNKDGQWLAYRVEAFRK